jgi:hypothetical protein
MAFSLDGARVTLRGPCPVEEAPDLHRALIDIERPVFDLDSAGYVHTAIVQVMLASRGVLTRAPPESLAAALAGLEVADVS